MSPLSPALGAARSAPSAARKILAMKVAITVNRPCYLHV
jgi:hypothetical protein